MVISVFLIKTDLVSEKKKKKRCSDLNCREILAISTCFKLGPLQTLNCNSNYQKNTQKIVDLVRYNKHKNICILGCVYYIWVCYLQEKTKQK